MKTTVFRQTLVSALFGSIRTLVERETADGYGDDQGTNTREWLVAADVCAALGYNKDTSGVVKRHVSPEAQIFKHYVTAVILPSIRRHGAYMEEEVMDRVQATRTPCGN